MNLKEAVHQATIQRRLIKRKGWEAFMKLSPKAGYFNITIDDALATDWLTVAMDAPTAAERSKPEASA